MSFWPIVAASWLRWQAARIASAPANTRARLGSSVVERAGRGEAFDHALVDRARIDPRGEVGERGEDALAPLFDDQLDRLRADALQRGERVDRWCSSPTSKVAPERLIDGRLDLDAEPLRLGAEFRQLVGVVDVERHRRRQELDRIMRLHVGGLVGHQRVGRGVALVEAVVGEFRQQFEDRVGLPLRHAVLDRAGDEDARAACPSRRGSSCPSRGAAGRRRRANSPTSPARSASPVPGR